MTQKFYKITSEKYKHYKNEKKKIKSHLKVANLKFHNVTYNDCSLKA